VAELREIADGRADLLAERAGITLGFYARENRDEWQSKALQAALLIAAGADLTRLTEWIAVGQGGRSTSARRGATERSPRAWPSSPGLAGIFDRCGYSLRRPYDESSRLS
jgi:hypothetical protein